MDLDSLRKSPVGQLVPIKGTDDRLQEYSYFAFLPSDLPDAPDLEPEAWTAVTNAAHSLGRLAQACAQLPNPGLLIAPALAREAVDTSALEGTHGALADVLEARIGSTSPPSPEVMEISGYEQMAQLAFEWVKEGRAITIGMLCDLQKILADSSQEPPRDPGRIRTHQVVIGPRHRPIYDARYVPPPPDDRLAAGLNAWQSWVADNKLPVPLRAAMAHYQFEALHPFGDGNGRVGRLVVLLQLMTSNGDQPPAIPEPAITLSPWLRKRRSEYQGHLLRVSESGDWSPWVTFFCQGICEQAELLVSASDRLVAWLKGVNDQLHSRSWGGTIYSLSNDLIDWPVVTMGFVENKYGVSPPTAKHAVDRLVDLGVLEELTGKRYRKVFGATEVMRTVEAM